jgi:S1-C subfamily serine protease
LANRTHPVLGVGFVDVTPQQAASMKLVPPQGAFVLDVTPGSIASKAGITAGEVILEFGSTPISNATTLQDAVAKMQPGQHVEVKIWRGAPRTLDIQF